MWGGRRKDAPGKFERRSQEARPFVAIACTTADERAGSCSASFGHTMKGFSKENQIHCNLGGEEDWTIEVMNHAITTCEKGLREGG